MEIGNTYFHHNAGQSYDAARERKQLSLDFFAEIFEKKMHEKMKINFYILVKIKWKRFKKIACVTIMCRNDELSWTMS